MVEGKVDPDPYRVLAVTDGAEQAAAGQFARVESVAGLFHIKEEIIHQQVPWTRRSSCANCQLYGGQGRGVHPLRVTVDQRSILFAVKGQQVADKGRHRVV